MNQSTNITDKRTAIHNGCNAQVEAFINGGGKVITELPVKKKSKGTINMKTEQDLSYNRRSNKEGSKCD